MKTPICRPEDRKKKSASCNADCSTCPMRIISDYAIKVGDETFDNEVLTRKLPRDVQDAWEECEMILYESFLRSHYLELFEVMMNDDIDW